ncbi:MAG: hypothetical protein HY657_11370 [Acidobacteria bacterium]|nr:hypothetical protein [Acidobacteriota bacterium]
MKSIMPTQSFLLKAGEGLRDDRFTKRKLVFHDDMDDRVELSVGQFDSLATMVGRNQFDSFTFVCLEPIGWSWRGVRIVRIH